MLLTFFFVDMKIQKSKNIKISFKVDFCGLQIVLVGYKIIERVQFRSEPSQEVTETYNVCLPLSLADNSAFN